MWGEGWGGMWGRGVWGEVGCGMRVEGWGGMWGRGGCGEVGVVRWVW